MRMWIAKGAQMSDQMPEQAPRIKDAKSNAFRFVALSLIIAIPAAIYFIFFGFEDGNNVSRHGHIALTIGVVLAFLSAFLFMGIIFFSSRGGYDEQPNYVALAEKHRKENGQG